MPRYDLPDPAFTTPERRLPDQVAAEQHRMNQEGLVIKPKPRQLTVTPAGLPIQVKVSPETLRSRWFTESLAQRGGVLHAGIPGIDDYGVSTEQFGYWENPQRVARYYNMIRTAPPDWQPPEWLNKDAITDAYQYMRYKNNNKPWTEWDLLPEDDPARDFLRGLPTPPPQFLWTSEQQQYAPWTDEQVEALKPKSWEDASRWQQWLMSTPLVPQANVEGRPEISRLTSAGITGGIAGLGAAGIPTIIGGGIGLLVGGPAGMVVGAGYGATIGKIIAMPVGVLAAYQSYTEAEGTEAKAMNDVLNAFDVLAITTKRMYGVGVQLHKEYGGDILGKTLDVVHPGRRNIVNVYEDFKRTGEYRFSDPTAAANIPFSERLKTEFEEWRAEQKILRPGEDNDLLDYVFDRVNPAGKTLGEEWESVKGLYADWKQYFRAGEAAYAVSSNDAINYFAMLLDVVDKFIPGDYFGVTDLADKNQVWRISEGVFEPVTISTPRDAEALIWLRKKLDEGNFETRREAYDLVNNFKSNFGDTAVANDFVYESLADPANVAGFLGGKVGKAVGKITGNERLVYAFDATTGSPVIDALPFGVQQLAEAVTGIQGSKGPLAALEYYKGMIQQNIYPASMLDMPADMRAKYDELGKKGIKPDDIQVEGKVMTWTEDGVQKTFEASREATTPIKSVEELSAFDKALAGIDEEYGLKELRPVKDLNWIQRLTRLTPESQAHVMLNMFHSQLATLMNMASGDVDTMVKLVKQAAGLNPVAAGDLGEAILKSASTRAIQESVKYAVQNNDLVDNMLATWVSAERPRTLLQKISKALNETPGKVLDQLQTDPDALIARLNDVAPVAGDPRFIKDTLGVFVGDDRIPWNEQEFQAKLLVTMADQMEKYLTDHFDLKPQSHIFRLGRALKGVQSLVLLGLNPAYFLNNYINNVVTRAAVGVLGYMTPRQINDFLNRFGITPPRIDQGVSPMGEAIYGGRKGIAKAMEAGDVIDKATKAVRAVNNKLGIFSRLSADVERMESRQATVIAMKRFMGKAWKRGKGFRKLHPVTEAALDRAAPGMKEVLYQATEAGLNMDEIEGAIFGEYVLPQIEGVADQVDRSLFPNMPGMGKQLLAETGLLDELKRKLAKAENTQDVDIAFDDVSDQLESHIEQKTAQDIIDRAESVANIVSTERIPAILSLYGDMEIMIAQHWIDGRQRIDDLFARRSTMDYDQWQREYRAEEARQNREWRRVYALETQTFAGIIKAIGAGSEKGKAFVNQLNVIHETWREFHDTRRVLLDRFFNGYGRRDKETYDAYRKRRDLEWNKLQDELDDLYQKHYSTERAAQMEMDRLFAEGYKDWASWDVDRAAAWRAGIRDARYEMFNAQREQRSKVRNMTIAERDAAYVEFNAQYNRMIATMKQMEVDGAYDLMRRPATKKVTDVVPEEAFTPREQPGREPAETPTVEEAPIEPDMAARQPSPAQRILDLAKDYGIPTATKDGRPMDIVARNIIRKYQRENGLPEIGEKESIKDVDPDVIRNAFEEHRKRHEIEQVKRDIGAIIKAEDIIALADKQVREAKLKQQGQLTRREIEEKIRSLPKVTELEVKAVMTLMDLRADRWARQNGFEPSEATRDAWYATRIADVGAGDFSEPSLEQKLTGMNDIQRRDFLFSMNPIQIDTTSLGTERNAIVQGAREAYAKIADTTVVNVNDGREIKFRKRAIGKVLGHTVHNLYDAKVIIALPEIVENGILLFSSQARNHTDTAKYFQYGTKVNIDGESAYVRIIIREQNGSLYYDSHVTLQNEIEKALFGSSSASLKAAVPKESLSKDILLNWLTKVNNQEAGEGDLFQNNRGSIEFLKDGRAVIRAMNASDISTLVHEIGHIFRRDLGDNDLNVLAKLGGLKDAAEFRDLEAKFWNRTATEEEAVRYRNVEEMFAQGWERYLAEGLAPTLELRSLFKRFTDWMLNIYRELRKEGHKVSGFEKSQIGVDIRAQVNGVSLRDIFDRLLVDNPDRPKDYQQLFERKFEDVKNTGRNWRLDDLALKRRAEKELIVDILRGLEGEEDARRYAEAVEYAELSDGVRIDPTAVYDALTRIAEDTSLNPWAKETKQLRGTTTIARGISNPNNQYEFQFKVMELDDIQASNVWVGDRLELNPEYPQELQPRERTEAQSISQVDTIARMLVPEELVYDARALDRGAPIVGPDNAVESGNGRTLAIKRAAEMYPEKYQEYRAALIENAAALGIDSAQIEGMEKPVLVRERMTDTDRIKFVNDANKPIAMRMNVMEAAINDSRLISDESLMNLVVGENETIEGALQTQRNTWFVNRFLEKLSKNEAAELSNNGIINQQGIQRIINAVFAKVYPGAAGERLLRAFSMSMSSNVKAAENAIMASLPQIAKAEGMIANGARKADLSVTGDISIAVDKLANLRASNMSVSDYLGQISFLGDELTPTQKVLLKFISEQRQPKRIREFLREYAGLVEKEPDPNQMSLLGDMSRTKEELLNDAIKRIEPEAEGLFAIEPAREPTAESAAVEAAPAVPVDQLAQPIAGRPGVREDAARGMGKGEILEAYQDGRAIPIDYAEGVNLAHNDVLAIKTFGDLAEGFHLEARTFARKYIDWVLAGERGQAPEATSPAIEQGVINALADSMNEMRLTALEIATAKRTSDTLIPEQGTYITKVYRFKHGDANIVAAVYKDGELIAYLPDNYKTDTFEANKGQARILGLSPDDPGAKIYEIDGKIKSSKDLMPDEGRQALRNFGYSEDEIAVIEERIAQPSRLPHPYEIPLKEYVDEAVKKVSGQYASKQRDYARLIHKSSVREAIQQGKEISPDVLKDYPDLVDEITQEQISEQPEEIGTVPIDEVTLLNEKQSQQSLFQSANVNAEIIEAAKAMGITDDLLKAGYVDIEGNLLDLSNETKVRVMQHDVYVNKIYGLESRNYLESIRRFIDDTHAVRIGLTVQMGDTLYVNLEGRYPMTSSQIDTLEDQAYKLGAKTIDITYDTRAGLYRNRSLPVEDLRSTLRTVTRGEIRRESPVLFQESIKTDSFNRWFSWDWASNKAGDSQSVVVDLNNKPLVVYHGTPGEVFDAFNYSNVRLNGTTEGVGFYFIDNKNIATGYARDKGNVISAYLSIHKPIDVDQKKITRSQLKRIITEVIKDNPDRLSNYGDYEYYGVNKVLNDAVNLEYEGNATDLDLISSLGNGGLADYETINRAVVKVTGYDGIVVKWEQTDPPSTVYIAFLPEQIKSVDNISYNPQDPRILYQSAAEEPISNVPLYGTPEPQPSGTPLHELNASTIRPMLDRMKDAYKQSMTDNQQFKFANLDPVSQREVKKWLGTVRSDLASTKLAAMRYGEQLRDASLLNYSRRYGVDSILDMVYPYQFWYTRTMMNWAKRMIDKPGWFAMYARLERMQEEMERKGMPTRLRGKVRFPMPWLPEWTGQGIWSDPLKQIFPSSQFAQPLEQYASDKNQIMRRTEQVLNDMVEAEKITYSEAQTAKETQQGPAWDQAVKLAEIELDKSANPLNMVGMMMQPALWWTIPAHLASGNPEKISPLPITRTGQAIRTLGSGTIAEPATDFIGGLMAKPEEFVRRKAGLSEFGQWGDYYIDRTLSNMAAEGVISANDARIAMLQRQGPIFDQAKQRVEYEQMIRIPGTLPLLAVKEGAKPGEVLASILGVIFPGGLFPEGELKQRGLKAEYDNAWRKLKTGDDNAINDFFDKYPEYEARLALYDEPDQRLRAFLIDNVWQQWHALDKPNRRKVVQAFGQDFEDFLNKETRDEENIDVQLLADWAQSMGALLPKTEELEGLPEPTEIDLYQPELVDAITAYQTERDTYFPNYYSLQENYYSLPAGTQRKAFLRQFPQLREYWRWKDQYKKDHPELIEYFDDLKEDNDAVLEDAVNEMDPVMMNQLFSYSQGKKLTQGGIAEMQRLYKKYGKSKGLTLEEYINLMARSIYR